jgi:hypothetical protein
MFNKLKKAKNEIMGDGNPFAVAKKKCKEVGLPFNYFTEFVKNKGLNPLTDTTFELVDEFFNRPHLLYKLSIPVYVTLPETVFEIRGYSLYGSGNTKTHKKQLRVQSELYIPDNGLVFKKAFNKSEDLRISWDTITDTEIMAKDVIIICDSVRYKSSFDKKDLAKLFFNVVNENKCGKVADGWE